MTLFMVVVPVVSLYFAYWVIRLAVRHGMEDVFARRTLERRSDPRPATAFRDRLDDRLDDRESDRAEPG